MANLVEDCMEPDVQAVLENHVSGVTQPDAQLVRSAFRSDAHMWGYLGDTFLATPIEGFLTVVANTPDPAGWVSDYSYDIGSIEVTGDVAVAALKETGYLGGNFTAVGAQQVPAAG
jgi:Putative lumazine-binding